VKGKSQDGLSLREYDLSVQDIPLVSKEGTYTLSITPKAESILSTRPKRTKDEMQDMFSV